MKLCMLLQMHGPFITLNDSDFTYSKEMCDTKTSDRLKKVNLSNHVIV